MLIETKILSYLKNKLNSNKVYMEIPSPMPEQFVTIQLASRGRSDLINAVTFTVISYANSKHEAALLDEKVRDAMLGSSSATGDTPGIVSDSVISACNYGGGNDAPDTGIKKYRYRSHFNIYY